MRQTASRRSFIKAAACAVALPTVVPRSVFGANAPSNRLNVDFIGLGNQSKIDLPAFLKNDDVQVLAVCDVNKGSDGYKDPKDFLGREPGKQKVEAYYADKNPSGKYKGCDAYIDFRDVIARDDIDAVVIVVPDHWHALGAAKYRAGDWRGAIDALKKSEELPPTRSTNCLNALFLAMAHWQLSEPDEARQWYSKAIDWMEKQQADDKMLRGFQAEAEKLLRITEQNPATKPGSK
jgi:tetratricopeptide (TPR) repeat protein